MSVDIFADEPTPAPVPAPVPAPAGKSNAGGILVVLCGVAFAALLLFCTLSWHSSDGGDDVKPTPAVVDLHVLLLEESDDRDKLPREQAEIFANVPLREWLAANCASEGGQPAYRFFDDDDNLQNETPVWREMRQAVTEPPLVVLAQIGKKAIQFKPASPEAMQERLEKFKAGGK